uniref:Alcohol acetyltransferase ATF(B)3 n=1 Tax=Saccharomycopsis fibuligera TaxID=4944 RepID=A0A8F2J2P8_SACFI|nr:alcohol acetyltransferase ATF(B)3 [Saccharomycopsis fibuligera]
MTLAKDSFVGPLSFRNQFLYLQHTEGLYNSLSVTVQLTETPSRTRLLYAIQQLIWRYPNLVATVDDKHYRRAVDKTATLAQGLALAQGALGQNSSRWGHLLRSSYKTHLDVDKVLDVLPETPPALKGHDAAGPVRELAPLVRLNSTSFSFDRKNGEPLWKFVLYEETAHLAMVLDHWNVDGGSVVGFLKDLLVLLNSCSEEDARQRLQLARGNRIFDMKHHLDNFAESCDGSGGLSFHAKDLFPDFRLATAAAAAVKVASWLARNRFVRAKVVASLQATVLKSQFVDPVHRDASDLHKLVWKSEKRANRQGDNDRYLSYNIHVASDKLQPLLQNCKAHGITLTTVLHAALVLLYNMLLSRQKPDELKLHKRVEIYVNTRKLSPVKNVVQLSYNFQTWQEFQSRRYAAGFHTLSVLFFVEPMSRFQWSTFAKYHQHLHRSLNEETLIAPLETASRLLDPGTLIQDTAARQRDCFLAFSNLGFEDFNNARPPRRAARPKGNSAATLAAAAGAPGAASASPAGSSRRSNSCSRRISFSRKKPSRTSWSSETLTENSTTSASNNIDTTSPTTSCNDHASDSATGDSSARNDLIMRNKYMVKNCYFSSDTGTLFASFGITSVSTDTGMNLSLFVSEPAIVGRKSSTDPPEKEQEQQLNGQRFATAYYRILEVLADNAGRADNEVEIQNGIEKVLKSSEIKVLA